MFFKFPNESGIVPTRLFLKKSLFLKKKNYLNILILITFTIIYLKKKKN